MAGMRRVKGTKLDKFARDLLIGWPRFDCIGMDGPVTDEQIIYYFLNARWNGALA